MADRFFHGGVRGLEVGDRLLPPAETGASSCADCGGDIRRDRVYLARSEPDAAIYAGLHRLGGDVYEVEPVGPVEPDELVGPGGYSVCAPAARIVRVCRRGVTAKESLDIMEGFIVSVAGEAIA